MDEALEGFSDAELDALVEEMGIADAMAHIMFSWLEWKRIKGLKAELDEMSQWNGLSDKVNDFINYWRAKLVSDTGVTMQVNRDDRFGVNTDVVLAQFDLNISRESPQLFLDWAKWILCSLENNDAIGDFLMRTPEEYLQLLVYYIKVKSFDELRTIFTALEDNKQYIEWSRRTTSFWDRYYFSYFSDILRAPTEFFCAMSAARLEYILEKFQVKSVEDFNKLFIETHFMYALLVSVHPALLDYFWERQEVNTVTKLIDFIWDQEWRERLIGISNNGNTYVHNVIRLLSYFWEDTIDDLEKYDTWMSFLKEVKPWNLQVLLDIFTPTSFDELTSDILNNHIKDNIQNSDYEVLIEMLQWLQGDIDNQVIRKVISEKYNSSIGQKIGVLQETLQELWRAKGNVDTFIYHMFQSCNDIEWTIDELVQLLERLGESMIQGAFRNIDFSRLNQLSEFMWWTISSYLAYEVLHSSDTDELFSTWKEVLQSFTKWKFDASKELHINLEYTNFQQISWDEQIAKYMKGKFNFQSYASIFKQNGLKNKFYEQDTFELECIAYEAWLLRDYIFEVNEIAKQSERRVLVVPNLSYGYLPVTAIIDDLEWDDNIDILMWLKVGSTESHSNREVLNPWLFKWSRWKIMNDQPIIIVVDGTNHLIPRHGDGKWARYPDAYQWYLNQVIAMNYANWMDDKEKVNYSPNGKDKRDIERLFDSEDFQILSEIYSWVRESRGGCYDFKLWNTAWKDLIIRWRREELSTIKNFSPEDIKWPTMIFCNVWVLDEQLPDHIKRGDFKHIPAYFDDSWRIIDFEYSFDNTGVKTINSIEVALREITWASGNHVSKNVASIIRYSQRANVWE